MYFTRQVKQICIYLGTNLTTFSIFFFMNLYAESKKKKNFVFISSPMGVFRVSCSFLGPGYGMHCVWKHVEIKVLHYASFE